MSQKHSHIKHIACIQHRQEMFDKAFEKYLAGEVSAEYLKLRADKLKQVTKK